MEKEQENTQYDSVKKYILSQPEVEVPSVQKMFSLSYLQMKTVIDELTESKKIEYKSGVTYATVSSEKAGTNIYRPKNDMEKTCINALWLFVCGEPPSTSVIQRRFSIGFATAASAMDWMENNKFISPLPERKVLMSRAEFIDHFGNPDENPISVPEEFSSRSANGPFRFDKFLGTFVDDNGGNDDDEDDDEDDDDDGDFDESDFDGFLYKSHTENLDQNIESARERMKQLSKELLSDKSGSVKVDDNDIDIIDGMWTDEELVTALRTSLFDCFDVTSYNDVNGCGVCELTIEDSLKFKLEFVNNGSHLRMSDCGSTVAQSTVTERRIKNVLKGYCDVSLDNGEIAIISKTPMTMLISVVTLYAAIDAVRRLK